jgi:uncharacterized protein YcgI (DUF1989 family)
MAGVSVHVAPQTGEFAEVPSGQLVRVTDIEGHQVGDFFATRAAAPGDWLSVAQTRNFTERLVPRPGDTLFSSTGDPIMGGRLCGISSAGRPDCCPHRMFGGQLRHQQLRVYTT